MLAAQHGGMDTYGDVPLGVECAWPAPASGDAAVLVPAARGDRAQERLEPGVVGASSFIRAVLLHAA
jgi:hypothetical protein